MLAAVCLIVNISEPQYFPPFLMDFDHSFFIRLLGHDASAIFAKCPLFITFKVFKCNFLMITK